MLRLVRVLAAVFAVAIALAGCASGNDAVDVNNGGQFRFVAGTPSGEVIPVADRAAAPAFSGVLIGGGDYRSSALAGDVAVLNFWGSWCGPCRLETPQFQQVYADVGDQGVSFLGIDVKDTEQMARAFVGNHDVTFPSIFDPRGEIALVFQDYPPSTIPSTILLDRQGRVAAVYLGPVAQDQLRAVIDMLLEEA